MGKIAMQCYSVNEMIAGGIEAVPQEEDQVKKFSPVIYTTGSSVGALIIQYTSATLTAAKGFRQAMDI